MIRKRITVGLVALVLSLRLVAPMVAGPIEDTAEAVRRGDYTSALRVWRPLADQGNATAQALLANSYLSGLGVQQDYAEAAKWLRKAADQGFALAQFGLGLMYAKGDGGLPQDYAEAVAWYRKAADQGLASAQGSLGQMYAEGQGVPQDYAAAAKWYLKSANQGSAVAQNNLGSMYASGQGVTRNYVQAHMWYSLAEQRFLASESERREIAIKNRNDVAAKMTTAQIAEAQKLAREWKPIPQR
jgi:TPR repeat protein